MFSKAEMVARKAVESLYDGQCTITEYQKVKKENKSTGFQEVEVHRDQPCRISFQTIKETDPDPNGASAVRQAVKLFLAPEIRVEPGSKITVTQNGTSCEYKNSGEAARYFTHQEIPLELFRGWA